ncbi:MAG: shikimate kinase [Chlorobiaceae bacterium]|nr:shikimate kinase [Chlorobiaceae bacterium]
MVTEELRKQNLYLTGFMGSGKSTLGPILANTIGYTYTDLDKEIEKREGKSITHIFEQKGEKYFRKFEKDILFELSNNMKQVISLGGGVLQDIDNLRIVKKHGILLYLKIEPELLMKRLKNKTDRPLLRNIDGGKLSNDEFSDRINSLLLERKSNYQQAELVVEIENEKVGITIDKIVKTLKPFLTF